MIPPNPSIELAGLLGIPPFIDALFFAILILALFHFARDRNWKTSKALWIPAVWLFLTSSRPVSMWLGLTPKAGMDTVYLEGSPIDRYVLMFLVAAGLAVVARRVHKVGPLLRKNGLILLFFTFAALSILWSEYPFVTFKHVIKGIGDVAMVLIILTEADPLGALKRLITRLGFILFPLSILFIKYYPNLGRILTRSWTEEAVGVSTQKNGLGLDCLIFGIGFLWVVRATLRERKDPILRNRLRVYWVILGMIVWLLWACGSMTSITSLVMAGGVMLLACRPAFIRRRASVHILVIAVLAVSLTALFFDPGGGMVEALGKDPTLSGRTNIWKEVLTFPVNRWVGTGYESFWLGDRLKAIQNHFEGEPLNEAHDGYLEIYLNLGWVGVSLLALLLLSGYRKVIRHYRKDPDSGSLLLAFFLAALLEGLTEAAFRMMTPSWIFLLFAITATSLVTSSEVIPEIDLHHVETFSELEPSLSNL